MALTDLVLDREREELGHGWFNIADLRLQEYYVGRQEQTKRKGAPSCKRQFMELEMEHYSFKDKAIASITSLKPAGSWKAYPKSGVLASRMTQVATPQ